MKNINKELVHEVENRSEGILREIAIDIIKQINEDHSSDEAIRTFIKRKVDAVVREELL